MRIVICCDGTWDERDGNIAGGTIPSNVCLLSEAVLGKDAQSVRQLCQYFSGVGTSGSWIDRILGGAFGDGLDERILEAYRFLVAHYHAGDEVFLFGFSRGAYTVRSLAGLIRNSGLLYSQFADHEKEAFALYRRREAGSYPDGSDAVAFRAAYSREIRIKCIGVWDTVGALGVPLSLFEFLDEQYQFHDVALSSYVDNAFQALAIDERRKPFAPALWAQQQQANDNGQVLQQVWFAGIHTDIGGGATQNYLSSISFQWMAARAASCGLALNPDFINDPKNFTLHPEQPLHGVITDSCTGLYRFLGVYDRPIGQGADIVDGATPVERYRRHSLYPERAESNEMVSACANARFLEAQNSPEYRYRSFDPSIPVELESYLAGGGAVTQSCP